MPRNVRKIGPVVPMIHDNVVEEPIRIISDLHLGHSASLARNIAQVEPLFQDVRSVVFNGDTIEMRSERSRERAQEILLEVQQFCRQQHAATCFINGNHDPIISTTNHLELGEGSLLVTHGDVLFHETPHRSGRATHRNGGRPKFPRQLSVNDRATLEQILSTNKRVSHAISYEDFTIPNGPWGQFTTFMRQTWPPRRFVSMVSNWKDNPGRAVDLVRVYCPRTRCVIVGHTHLPGIWHRHGYHVINTGSYLPMLGRLAVDYCDDFITVRKVVLRRGKFHLGRQMARFRLHGQVKAA
jgi:predicted phosphodiesterase